MSRCRFAPPIRCYAFALSAPAYGWTRTRAVYLDGRELAGAALPREAFS